MTDIKEMLSYINPSDLDYQEWVNVGMALKHEGFPCSVWDDWSKNDTRYKRGACSKKWESFKEGAGSIVTGGTIFELATRFGFKPGREVTVFGWDDYIEYDGDVIVKDTAWLNCSPMEELKKDDLQPTKELERYISALFKPDEFVGYVVKSRKDEERNKYVPGDRGVYHRTAGELLEALEKHPEDLGATIGDYFSDAGAWIRFNPLDGVGVGNQNVTSYRFALVESDSIEIEKQKAIIEELKLPVAVMVSSGGKSIHAIVRINASNSAEYQERVEYLYSVCDKNGLSVDKQNKNPSRLSRMPGVMRGDKCQYIIAENIGCKSFEEWQDYIEDTIDTLPEIMSFDDDAALPELAPELIGGVLRQGHKMLISGASKAGKSFLLIELAVAIANGSDWLGHHCRRGKVLYINLEVDGASFLHRVKDVSSATRQTVGKNLDIWNLRGENTAIDKLAPRLIRRAKSKGYAAIILDPLYKVNQGDENSASEMARFFNQLDYIGKELQASIICCHHHSKGAQGAKASMDRSSGSGVFARDPDAILDMIQIYPDESDELEEGDTVWRVAHDLREFRAPADIDIIFRYPRHIETDAFKDCEPMYGVTDESKRERGHKTQKKKKEERVGRLLDYINNWEWHRPQDRSWQTAPKIEDAMEYFQNDRGFSKSSIKSWAGEEDAEFIIDRGYLYLK